MMLKTISTILILLHLILIIPLDEVLAAEYRLKATSFSSGEKAENANYKLKQAAIGEPFGGKVANSNYKAQFGYIPSTATVYPRLTANIPDGFVSGSADLDDYFEDPSGRELTYSVIGNTNIDVTIDLVTHIVTWSHSASYVGSEEIFFIAKNIENAEANSNGVILTAKNPSGNTAPKLHYIEDITEDEGDLITINAAAYDADGDTLTFTYTYPFDSDGQWQTSYEDAGMYAVTVTVYDGQGGSDSQTAQINVKDFNRTPIIESVNGITVLDG